MSTTSEEADCIYCSSNEVVRAWAPKGPALLSVIGSIIVIRELLLSDPTLLQRRNRTQTIPRILFAMSISDLFFSIPYIFTTWLAPAKIDLYQSYGTVATCTLQGTSLQFGVSTSPLFSLALSICAMLMLRYNWNPYQLAKLELPIFSCIYIYGLAATIPFIPLQMYNPTTTTCWITEYPRGCIDDECERGGGPLQTFFGAFFAFFPTWPSLIISFMALVLILFSVRKKEEKNSRYMGASVLAFNNNTTASRGFRPPFSIRRSRPSDVMDINSVTKVEDPSEILQEPEELALQRLEEQLEQQRKQHNYEIRQVANRKRSKAVAIQAVLYTIFFMLTYSMDTILILFHEMNWRTYDWMNVFAYMLFPMQGFFNFIIFARPRGGVLKTKEGRFFRNLFFGTWIKNGIIKCYEHIKLFCCSQMKKSQSIEEESKTYSKTTELYVEQEVSRSPDILPQQRRQPETVLEEDDDDDDILM